MVRMAKNKQEIAQANKSHRQILHVVVKQLQYCTYLKSLHNLLSTQQSNTHFTHLGLHCIHNTGSHVNYQNFRLTRLSFALPPFNPINCGQTLILTFFLLA